MLCLEKPNVFCLAVEVRWGSWLLSGGLTNLWLSPFPGVATEPVRAYALRNKKKTTPNAMIASAQNNGNCRT